MIRWFVLVIVLSYSTCCLTFLVWSGKSWEWCLLFDWRHPRNAIVIKQFSVFTSWAKLRRLKSMYFFLFLLFPFMILLKSSDFNGFDHISSHNGEFTYQIWYDDDFFSVSDVELLKDVVLLQGVELLHSTRCRVSTRCRASIRFRAPARCRASTRQISYKM